MKLSEGIQITGCPFEIPDSSRNDLPEFFKDKGYKVGVEVGVFQGEYTEVLAKSGLQIYGVDPWMYYRDYSEPERKNWMEINYGITTKRLAPYQNVKILRKTSMEAVQDFEDESIDFVYIDGNHRFKYVADDLWEWTRKVKTGGIISGHDYAYFKHHYFGGGCQVREVVDAFVTSYHLNFWVLGSYRALDGEKRDRMRSWMFIKTWSNQ